jgi:hypothetical protein
MSERKQGIARAPTLRREEFLKDPAAALRKAEAKGAVVIKNKDGSVHSVLSVPRDDRPIVVK